MRNLVRSSGPMRAASAGRHSPSRARCASTRPAYTQSRYRYSQSLAKNHLICLKAQESDQQGKDVDTPSDLLLSALTSIGLYGTVAVTGASLCGINTLELFRWNESDIALALELNSALILLELLLFAPKWDIPAPLAAKADPPKQQQQMQLVDMSAVKHSSIWSPDSWQLMLTLYKTFLRRPQTNDLPFLVSTRRC